ncbi:MAG: hypothetical protein GF418_17355, partial [Chitinivibrionales bacterium]|nr:hypothetical protein [Chitinivibrionales bacterium]MBD3397388.1 hypothetical protein [Chitinivibrionales bacterium]
MFRPVLLIIAVSAGLPHALPTFPIGMNIGGLNYYTRCIIFTDVMTTASDWITYHEGSEWNTGVRDQLDLDSSGYPVEVPQTIEGHATMVRFLINNHYTGRYRFLYDGEGAFSFNVPQVEQDNGTYITLDGTGGHVWIQITSSRKDNHVRNIRIVPDSLEDTYDPADPGHLFYGPFLKGLEPFHALRFMDWMHTNGSQQKRWSDRVKPADYSQGTRGVCIDHAITLCNYLGKDAWFCVPHAADDEYIAEFARMARDRLNSALTVYVEYSNEIWNWGFDQAHWVGKNGRDPDFPHLDCHDTLYQQFRDVALEYCDDPESYCHPEKDAHAMQRVFNIWRGEFFDAGQEDRLVRVAAIQVGWCGNNSRILGHLDKHGGADALSPTSYFNFTEENHETWLAMNPSDVTADMVID